MKAKLFNLGKKQSNLISLFSNYFCKFRKKFVTFYKLMKKDKPKYAGKRVKMKDYKKFSNQLVRKPIIKETYRKKPLPEGLSNVILKPTVFSLKKVKLRIRSTRTVKEKIKVKFGKRFAGIYRKDKLVKRMSFGKFKKKYPKARIYKGKTRTMTVKRIKSRTRTVKKNIQYLAYTKKQRNRLIKELKRRLKKGERERLLPSNLSKGKLSKMKSPRVNLGEPTKNIPVSSPEQVDISP